MTLLECGATYPLGQKLYQLEGPIETSLSIDGAEIRTKAMIICDENFPDPILIGRAEVSKKGMKSLKDMDGTIGLDDDATVLIPFASAGGFATLKGLIDTGAGPSIM